MKCQLIALEHGFISLVDEMQEMYDSIVTDANSSEDSHEDIVSKVNRCLKDALKGQSFKRTRVKELTCHFINYVYRLIIMYIVFMKVSVAT